MTPCDGRKRDPQAIRDVLQNAGADVSNPRRIRCPFHDDHHPSAEIKVGDDGVHRFYCYSGNCGVRGDVFDVEAHITGRPAKDIMREYRQQHEPPQKQIKQKPDEVFPTIKALADRCSHVVAVHARGYADPITGEIPLVVLRIEPPGERKRFIQCRPERGGWVMRKPDGMMPLYNRVGIIDADKVMLVEGEKCVGILRALGIPATTWPGGCKAPLDRVNWPPLAGKADVYLWPDADAGGIEAMRTAARLIEALPNPPRLHWIDPAALQLTDGDDVADVLASCIDEDDEHKRQNITRIMADAQPMGASREVMSFYADVRDGKVRCVPMPWRIINRATQAMMPGSITLLAGGPGVSKSFMLVQLARALDVDGVPVVVRMLEKDRAYHLRRALAQHVGQAGLADLEWLEHNADEAEVIAGEQAGFLDRFGRCIQDTSDGITSLHDLADWVERQAQRGMRVIAIDPITLADAGDKRWEQDRDFMARCGKAIGKTGASLILTTHPPKGVQGTINLDHLAGGAAYTRAADTVLYIEHHADPKEVTVKRSGHGDMADVYPMPFAESINRTLHILKARNAAGNGWRVGFMFDRESLTFRELGVIVRNAKIDASEGVA